MEDHKNVIFKIASIWIGKLKKVPMDSISLFRPKKSLQFGTSIFQNIRLMEEILHQ